MAWKFKASKVGSTQEDFIPTVDKKDIYRDAVVLCEGDSRLCAVCVAAATTR